MGNIHNFLHELREKGVLRYGQGWYHIPASLRKELQQASTLSEVKKAECHVTAGDALAPYMKELQQASTLSEIKKAEYHVAAGAALAPYTLDTPVPSLAFDRAFLPENIYEAFFHFDRATWRANNVGTQGQKIQSLAIDHKVRLLRFAAFQTWSIIRNLANCPRPSAYIDAYTMGREPVEAREKDKSCPLHPGSYLAAIQAGERWFNAENNLRIKETLDQEIAGPEGLFEKALAACEEPLSKNERKFNRLLVLSQYANYLAHKGSESSERVAAFDREVMQLIDAGEAASGVRGEWFERAGDEKMSHVEAAHVYRRCVEWVPEWHQLWVKALGAATLAAQNTDWISASVQGYAARRASRIRESFTVEEAMISIISHADERWDQSPQLWVKERWDAGVRWIEKNWRYSEKVRRVVQELKRYNVTN